MAGANDAALGNIKNPDNTSAIVAVQQATAAPLSLTRLAYYQMIEDYTRVIIDMMHAYYEMCIRDRIGDMINNILIEVYSMIAEQERMTIRPVSYTHLYL